MKLTDYLNSLSTADQKAFADRCGTSVNYLRKANALGQKLRVPLAIDIERESGGVVRCEEIRTDIDWQYLKTRKPQRAVV
jgi:DNA-binding transcriptional regulator YdaS (Cro superfamily)